MTKIKMFNTEAIGKLFQIVLSNKLLFSTNTQCPKTIDTFSIGSLSTNYPGGNFSQKLCGKAKFFYPPPDP